MTQNLDASIRSLIPELIETRRDLHRHPEIGFDLSRTAEIVANRLESLGYEVQRNVAQSGVVGLWRGNGSDENAKTLAFRADMDALPLREENTHNFVSTVSDRMHACGHDGHTAILLGLARWLAERPARFPGNVKLIFQPAEETPGGALPMIEEGVLENPKVDCIVGLHLWPMEEIGRIGIRPGPIMASADHFELTVKGKGGHGAMPHLSVDAVAVAAQIVTALQTIVSRNIDPLEPAVVTIGAVEAGSNHNIIAETAFMKGTARAFSPEVRERFPEQIRRIAEGVAHAMGAEIDFRWDAYYPPTINDKDSTNFVAEAAAEILGVDGVHEAKPSMGAEDMSYFLENVPGSYFFLYAGNAEKDITAPLHNPRFDIDEDALPLGVAILARIAERFFT